ncbi:2-hydroxyhepta-2,4-diene-1,7-dioate isomerase [Streptomyces abyssalis]|uniref:2-hydroxyhepta-2,4-diene-1,7-dioate isomerase n=1 Tax=Streptomyces abyssalis TaxID=933944 RepID=A0A1E7JJD1_9ACTN|nr:fumarylacetoacetate hydrolase family protein [Streptomyces abyssalis]OEU87201.1 2-hydroxyhepta-2,4-diene-1,7-dioate isomerase [Streptomyces abyssalis]OEU87735.1 2-hydroxyhepta-2,4-diene-1,7-dioate isomerase [Streptomyces abyssalis]OEV29790.1 2-hydroxyhepta-2,4-diene-1,7-dioate isomerase [Streptomyces nanshensis]
MKLATVRTAGRTEAVRVADDGTCTALGFTDVGELLAEEDWLDTAAIATAPSGAAAGTGAAAHPLDTADLAPVVPRPGKVICVGPNYRDHIIETGRELPGHPTLFAKYADALIGPRDSVELAEESEQPDWGAELAVVVGDTVRRADATRAERAIAGFTVLNDVTMRDWQYRTEQWLQGKTFENTTPLGPVLVTPDELPGGTAPALTMTCSVDDETMQKADTSDLVFGPAELVRYISTVLTLRPGDVIATGTPGGAGHTLKPPRHLTEGSRLVTEISGIGRLENSARRPAG